MPRFCEHVRKLEERLWKGFSGVAGPALQTFMNGPGMSQQRAEAALVMARYHAEHRDWAAACACLEQLRSLGSPLVTDRRARIIGAYAEAGLGRYAKARQILAFALEEYPKDTSLCVAAATVDLMFARKRRGGMDIAAARASLASLNVMLRERGFVGLTLRDARLPLSIGNITAASEPAEPAQMAAKVSVLMPVYNAGSLLREVVRGLLHQTWRNIEVILVDDASTDASWELIRELASADSRIIPLRQAHNQGAYAARNLALTRATGQFVTINDADDWPHPQKLQTQVEALLRHDNTQANTSSLLRVDADMIAQPRFDSPRVPIVHRSYPSLLLPRKLVNCLGGWDAVRVAADSELMQRIGRVADIGAISNVEPDVPLSISLAAPGNLTSAGTLGIRTLGFGARREYMRHAAAWHQAGMPGQWPRSSCLLPFPVPMACYTSSGSSRQYDVIVLSDFRDTSILERYCTAAGRMAIVLWPNYGDSYAMAMTTPVLHWCRKAGVVPLVAGEKANCETLVIAAPEVLAYSLDTVPQIVANQVVVCGDRSACPHLAGIDANLLRLFGSTGCWVG